MSLNNNRIQEISLTQQESVKVRDLINQILDQNPSVFQLPELCMMASIHMPLRLRECFHEFKWRDSDLALVLRNNPIQPADIPPTPEVFRESLATYPILKTDVCHMLYCCLLGEPFAFASQRNGALLSSIQAKRDLAHLPNHSAGSKFDFGFHTEDAFHLCMPDYLGLICNRNLEKSGTVVSSFLPSDLDMATREILFRHKIHIGANRLHQENGQPQEQMFSVLFGDIHDPYLRINVPRLQLEEYSLELRGALERLVQSLEKNRTKVVLDCGDAVYINNFKAVHGRDKYTPNFENPRWLTRIVITHDLRKSRGYRKSPQSRVIL